MTIRQDGDEEGVPVITPANFTGGHSPETNYTYLVGTMGSQSMSQTANATERAARFFETGRIA